jgi:LAO/AO transport system kinase
MLERGDPEAASVMREVDHLSGRAYTIGITGPPGAGKSTIVDRLTELLRSEGLSVGILAVDPTSPFSGGALLGDRIRMQRHYLDSGVFIRSVATRGQAGGLPRIVKSMARLLDASSKDVVVVETVGVGQTELGIMGVADTVLVILIPESGDAIQTLKAGVMEIADVFVVNKADREGANQMAVAIRSMLHTAAVASQWELPVVLTSAHTGDGIEELWGKIQEHRRYLTDSANLEARRESRRRGEFLEAVQEELSRRLKNAVESHPGLIETTRRIASGEAEPYSAAIDLLESMESPLGWAGYAGPRT